MVLFFDNAKDDILLSNIHFLMKLCFGKINLYDDMKRK